MENYFDTQYDAFGHTLYEGDEVIYYTGNEARLKRGFVTKVAPTFIKVKPKDGYNDKEAKLRSGRICMKVEK